MVKMNTIILPFFIVAVMLALSTHAKVFEVTISNIHKDRLFLTDFCFASLAMDNYFVNFDVKYNKNNGTLKYLLFNDNEWPNVTPTLTCQELSAMSQVNQNNQNILPESGALQSPPITEHTRPHFWYVMLVSCDTEQFNDISLTVSFLNPGSWWERQFSKDEQGILQLHLVYLFFYCALSSLFAVNMFQLYRARSLHLMVKIFCIILAAEFLGVFFCFIHYASYASNGVGVYGLLGLGSVLKACSEIVFMLLLLVMSSGWTISSNQLQYKKIFLSIFIVLILLYIVLFIWAEVGTTPGSHVYLYDTVPGIIIAVLRLPIMLFFAFMVVKSRKQEPDDSKRAFYGVFSVSYSLWFLILPLVVLLAAFLEPWVRAKIVESVSMTLYYVSVGGMVVLLTPSLANRWFALTSASAGVVPYENL